MKKLLLISILLFSFTTLDAGISTKRQDILKLIGTTYAPNGKFAWIELNGEDYGWNRECGYVGGYKIVKVEMGKVIVESWRKTLDLVMHELCGMGGLPPNPNLPIFQPVTEAK